MKGLLIRWIVSAIALYLTSMLAQSLGIGIVLTGALPALLAVVVLAIVNALIRPLVVILTLPLNCLTLGLFTIVINALMFWLVGYGWLEGFKVDGALAALFGSVVMGVISGLTNSIVGKKDKD
ncbi:MAG: phage holin family protein [Armatimonadota bacterium]